MMSEMLANKMTEEIMAGKLHPNLMKIDFTPDILIGNEYINVPIKSKVDLK